MKDLLPPDNLAYLLKYDSIYGRYEKAVEAGEEKLPIDGSTFPMFSEKEPPKMPWKDLDVDAVFECTGSGCCCGATSM